MRRIIRFMKRVAISGLSTLLRMWNFKYVVNSSVDKAICGAWGVFQNTYELLDLRALKYSPVNKIHIFQFMGKIFCVEFQRYP